MEVYSIYEVIEQAVQAEKLGFDFYSARAKQFAHDEELKKLFDILAGQELRHEKIFSALKEKTGELYLENWEEASRYLRAIVESEFFLGRGKSLASLEHIKSAEDAVRYAIGFEKETLLYYHGLRDIVNDKEILDRIISEEKSHIVWLNEFKKTYMK